VGAYGAFLAFAIVLILMPGPDFAVVTKNTLAAGRWRGGLASVGVARGEGTTSSRGDVPFAQISASHGFGC
jgi:threonine/homoserine/homoserine lactone efflux protein